MDDKGKLRVKEQFGANPEAYATSKVHAKGASLVRMVALVKPESHWQALDVATAAGHTALAFAPHVAHVTATDITPEMLTVARKLADSRAINNITFQVADAEALPFEDGRFNLVTCRIAAHHFPGVTRFLAESVRVLRPGGTLAVVDNVVPGSRLRGKKAERAREAGRYVNAFERLRDPSHQRCLSLVEWEGVFLDVGISLVHRETLQKEMTFEPWAERMRVSPENKVRLKVMLLQAPVAVHAFLTPKFVGDRIAFCLTEAILIGRLESA